MLVGYPYLVIEAEAPCIIYNVDSGELNGL